MASVAARGTMSAGGRRCLGGDRYHAQDAQRSRRRDLSENIPRYRQIEDYLLERIRSGEFPVNHQIPPEEQLARDFGVSRMTANKAIRDLVHKGYLVRQAGLGTFVTDIQNSFRLSSLLPAYACKVSESGISHPDSVKQLKSAGFNGFLIGENFMKTDDPGAALNDFITLIQH